MWASPWACRFSVGGGVWRWHGLPKAFQSLVFRAADRLFAHSKDCRGLRDRAMVLKQECDHQPLTFGEEMQWSDAIQRFGCDIIGGGGCRGG